MICRYFNVKVYIIVLIKLDDKNLILDFEEVGNYKIVKVNY